jgi:hypothetical protein
LGEEILYIIGQEWFPLLFYFAEGLFQHRNRDESRRVHKKLCMAAQVFVHQTRLLKGEQTSIYRQREE